MNETIVISLGGSLVIPDSIDIDFLKNFRDLILSQTEKGKKFIIITGGGKIAREYINVVKNITNPTDDNLDWIGIAVTRLNAELLRVVFGESACPKVIIDPDSINEMNKPIMLGAGWKPGNSSDLAAVHSAISVGAKKVINLSNTDYVYDSDPKTNPSAKKIEKISWKDYRSIIPEEWNPGLNTPFDPVASKKAEENGMTVIIMNGKSLQNLVKCLEGEDFMGTIISPDVGRL